MMTQIDLISPIDGTVYASRPATPDSTVELALAKARKAQADWAALAIEERIAKTMQAMAFFKDMAQEMAPELAWQMGRPIRYGAGEITGMVARARYMADIAPQSLAPIILPDRKGADAYIERQPLGIVFVIAPWNYPFYTAVNSIVPGLIAGNVVLLKHATQTLLVGERFAEAFEKAGLPEGVFQNLLLSHEQTERMLSQGLVDRVNFTGSVQGGRNIEKAAAGTFCHVGLELGGKDPAYVCADADFDYTLAQLLDGSFFNSGQCCCGIERIYVEKPLYDKFLEAFIEGAKGYDLGSPLEEKTTLGPMAHKNGARAVRLFNKIAIQEGARAHIDPSSFPADEEETPYIAPQVLSQVTHEMNFMREEVFGPSVGIMPVENDAEAVKLMNDSDYGLTASVWTSDKERALKIGNQVPTGTFFMNRCDYLDPGLGWTGIKNTGKGVTLSSVGYEHLTRIQSFYLREEF